MTWSPQQEAALKAVGDWLRDPSGPQVYRLFGYAGTGKTTLALEISRMVKGKVCFGAFTGKAALVLRSKGCHGASTIHSMIYSPEGDEETGITSWIVNPASPVATAKLVIIDECSMVDEDLGADLLSFGTKVLVLGDPAQLPPVKGAGFFTAAEPNLMLTEIHRQARDNPIIAMSTMVREGRRLTEGYYGDSVVLRGRPEPVSVLATDQVLVGKNVSRRSCIDRLRQLKNLQGEIPLVGEKLVCLRNNKTKGLLNGGIWTAEKISAVQGDAITMVVSPQDAGGARAKVEVETNRLFFSGREMEIGATDRRRCDEFDFGYALTVHKSQGSQWDDVLIFDESGVFREDRHRWLYTGITRAAQRVTVVIQ